MLRKILINRSNNPRVPPFRESKILYYSYNSLDAV